MCCVLATWISMPRANKYGKHVKWNNDIIIHTLLWKTANARWETICVFLYYFFWFVFCLCVCCVSLPFASPESKMLVAKRQHFYVFTYNIPHTQKVTGAGWFRFTSILGILWYSHRHTLQNTHNVHTKGRHLWSIELFLNSWPENSAIFYIEWKY